MQIELNEIDLGFAVSLAVLREVLASLTMQGRRWWIASDPADALANRYLTIGHGDPGCVDRLNTLYYRIPVLNEEMPLAGTEKLIILIESSVVVAEQPGLYIEKGRVVQDEIEDIQSFLFPILRALAAKFEKQ
jgi:hypothetical protein